MTPISSNKPVFFGNNGDPLKSGYVYIGQPDRDPRTAPKTVTFEDSGGNQFTAVQPLRTNSDGRIAYNGKAIVALVDGEYSMLVLDSAQQEINGGYHPSIELVGTSGGSTGGFNELTRVGLVLDDIKSFDVSVGDMVENLGKTLAQDDLGAEWLAVSATGNPADDVDLIDFDNGLQGVRVDNKTYRKDVNQTGTFLLDDPVLVVSTNDATSYRNTWTDIDISSQVPANASSAIMRVALQASYAASGVADSISLVAAARRKGSTKSLDVSQWVGRTNEQIKDTTDIVSAQFVNEFQIKLNPGSAPEFQLYIIVNDPSSGSNNTTPDLDVTVVGYTINYDDVVG